ncbi:hypothetical protein AB0N05_37655 [Nocardia sp. NPDC051030]|uniref:hypothetical protein n=1 Tax=Nocardia sp. NPDC051030 TaxID=3155162 RepID=UPI00341763C1
MSGEEQSWSRAFHETLGRHMQRIRLDQGLDVDELAATADVGIGEVLLVESGGDAGWAALTRLCEALSEGVGGECSLAGVMLAVRRQLVEQGIDPPSGVPGSVPVPPQFDSEMVEEWLGRCSGDSDAGEGPD